jgi:hypothetical protein
MEEMMNITSELLGTDAFSRQQLHGLEKAHRYQAMHERTKRKKAEGNDLQEIGISRSMDNDVS